ncbi:MAG: hypothetical protein ACSHYA_18940 [Opitutaceae bacterium]
MKIHLSALFLVFFFLLVGCTREHVDGRLITSYSIEITSEADRETLVNEFEEFLGQSGMKKVASPGTSTGGFKMHGENTEHWESTSAHYMITVSENPNLKYLSGDIAWNFRGSDADWAKLESELQQFQRGLVEWFKERPDVLHEESSYWDGSMNL